MTTSWSSWNFPFLSFGQDCTIIVDSSFPNFLFQVQLQTLLKIAPSDLTYSETLVFTTLIKESLSPPHLWGIMSPFLQYVKSSKQCLSPNKLQSFEVKYLAKGSYSFEGTFLYALGNVRVRVIQILHLRTVDIHLV